MTTIPTLLMSADGSPLAARRAVALLAEALPRAELRVVEGGGHMAPLTHAHLVNGWIAEHLDRASPD